MSGFQCIHPEGGILEGVYLSVGEAAFKRAMENISR